MTDEPKITLKVKLDNIFQMISNKVTSWNSTPSDDNYPSEKLVKDSLDSKASTTDLDSGLQNIGGWTIHTVTYVNGSASAYDISNGLSYAQQTPVFFLVKNTIGDNEANATLKYYPNGNNITIFDTLGSNYSPIQQGVWKKDTWGLFYCHSNNTVWLRCVFYDSVDIDDIKNNIINILGIENLPYYIVSSVSDDGKRITYNIDDYTIFDGNSFYLKVPYYETSTDRKVTLKQNNIYIKQSSNYVTESQVNGHLLKLRYNSGVFELLEIYDKLIPLFSDLSTVATTGSYNDLSNKPTIPIVPTNISAFTNDSGYLTAHQDITGKEDKSNKVTSLSSSSTDTEYPSAKAVFSNMGTLYNDVNNNIDNKISQFGTRLSSVATTGDYEDLINTPNIPSKVSDLTNDTGFITSSSVPNPSSTTPSADTTNGSVGTGTTWARSNHTHPKSSLYAEASHTHGQYLTSHQSIKTINNNSLIGTGNVDLSIPTSTSELVNDGDSQGFLYLTTNDIIDDLTSNIDNSPLSAKQGKVLKGLVDGKANSTHNHSISNVTDLQTTLNGKANSSHTHTVSNITNFPSIPSKTSDLTNDGADGTNVFVSNNDNRLNNNRNPLSNKLNPTSASPVDLNNVRDTGFYYVLGNANIQYVSNLPSDWGDVSFYLIVEETHDDNYCKQIIFSYGGEKIFVRGRIGGTWNVWKSYLSSDNVVDNLTSTSSTSVLSAKQGNVLKGLVDGKANSTHTHTKSNITDFPTIPSKTSDLTNDGDGTNVFVKNNDSRLSDARTPTSHTHTKSQITDFPTSMTPSSHSHGDLTNDGIISTSVVAKDTNDYPIVTDNSDSKKLKRGYIYTGFVWDNYARPNIGTSAQATQTAINSAIDTKIGSLEDAIPSKTSELTNDSGFLTSHQSLSNYYNKSETNNYDVDFVLGTQTASTSAWTGKTDVISSLRKGTTIFYKLPYASTSTAVTLNLTLKGGGTTGAKNVFYKNTSRVTTHYGVGQVVGLTYNGTDWYVISPSDNNSNNDNTYGGVQFKAGEALTTQTICCGKSNGQYYKVASGVVLDVRYPLIMTSNAVTSGTTTNTMYRTWYAVNIANTKSMTLTNGSQLFLEGTAYSDGKFTISSNVVTHTLTTGRYYIIVGTALSTTQIRFQSDMTVYYYDGTTLKPAIKKEQIVDFLDMIYPVGSIYMSVNSVNPSTLFGGTWEQIKDKFLLACGTSYSNGSTGGSANATLVSHNHYPSGENYFVTNDESGASNYRVGSATSGKWVDAKDNSGTFHHTQATNFVGSDGTGKNMPPYLAVNVWKRTA